MMFFFFSGGQGSVQIAPLILLLPFFLQFVPLLFDGVSITEAPSRTRRAAGRTASQGTLEAASHSSSFVNVVLPIIGIFGMIRFVRWVRTNGGWRFFVRLLFQGYQGGAAGVGPFRWQWGPALGQQAGQQGAGRPGAGRRRVTLEEVADALAKLPTEAYMTPQQMAALSVHELKALLHGRGLEPVKCLEKGELVRQLLEHGGSSADSCSICCEEYAQQASGAAAETAQTPAAGGAAAAGAGAGAVEAAAELGRGGAGSTERVMDVAERNEAGADDHRASVASAAGAEAGPGSHCSACGGGASAGEHAVPASSGCQATGGITSSAAAEAEDDAHVVLRVLRCGHRFHVECVDKWFLSATDYTREPACPLCNAPLIPPLRQ